MMDYNLGPASGTLVGNWMENRTLEEIGQPARVPSWEARKQDTFERVMPNCRKGSSRGWATETRTAMADVLSKATASELGPRAQKLQEELRKEADTYAATVLTPQPQLSESGTTSTAAYPRYDSTAYRAPVRRPHLTGAKSPGIEESKATDPKLEAVGSAGFDADTPVTFYSARLAEGVFFSSPAKSARNPFDKSAAFTNPIEEGFRAHGETNEKPEATFVTTTGSSLGLRSKAGSRATSFSIGLLAICSKFVSQICNCRAGPSVALATLLTELRDCVQPPMHLGKGPEGLSKTATGIRYDDSHVSQDIFRHTVAQLKLAMSTRDIECVVAASDDDGTDRLSIPLFLDNLAATLHPSRRELIQTKLFADCSVAAVEEIASRFQPERSWQVAAGIISEREALDCLLKFFLGAGVDAAVSQTVFEAYAAVVYAKFDNDGFRAVFDKEWA